MPLPSRRAAAAPPALLPSPRRRPGHRARQSAGPRKGAARPQILEKDCARSAASLYRASLPCQPPRCSWTLSSSAHPSACTLVQMSVHDKGFFRKSGSRRRLAANLIPRRRRVPEPLGTLRQVCLSRPWASPVTSLRRDPIGSPEHLIPLLL